MPICPKCGKSFSSEQALTYHLNKKYKCGTWKCTKCDCVFETKFAMKIHNMSCSDQYTNSVPSYDVLCNIYTKHPGVIFELDSNGIIHSVSPSCKDKFGFEPRQLLGKKSDELIEIIDNEVYRRTSTGELVLVHQTKVNDTIFIEYVV